MSTMRNSGLLKWTNNKNNKTTRNANKNWIHPPDALQGGHIAYLVKFLGHTEANQPKGIEVVKEAIRKLRFNQQLKKSEGTKTPKVELTISVDGVAIQQPKSKKVMFQFPLHQISYCADDKAEKRFFSFIAKESDREEHTCFVFVSDKLAEEITLTIGQAFDLAYRRFLQTSSREIELRRQIVSLQHQLLSSQSENSSLKDRLTKMASLKDREDMDSYMKNSGISDLLLVNGEHSFEHPIIHSEAPHEFTLPPIPPRTIKTESHLIEDLLSGSEGLHDSDDDDFDPRAEELKGSAPHTNGDSPGGSDDDFDPRANEKSHQYSFEIKTQNLDLNGLSPIPPLMPPPSRSLRSQDKSPKNLSDPFSVAEDDLLAQFNEMKAGFHRGLSFGTADSDFTLDSLDPLKN